MIFAFCITYLLPFVFINLHNEYDFEENSMNKYITRIKVCVNIVCIFSVLVIGINNIVYANGAYVYKKLVYDNTRLHAQTIWVDINSIDGYIEGETPVVFIGDFTSSKAAYRSSVANRYNQVLEGADSSSISSSRLLTHDASTKKFIGYTKIGRIIIGDNVFIGSGSIILPGVTIGNNVIIGAGSVIRTDIPDNSVVTGNPATIICSTSEYMDRNKAKLVAWKADKPIYESDSHNRIWFDE